MVGLDDFRGLFQPKQVCDSGISISKKQHCPNISEVWECRDLAVSAELVAQGAGAGATGMAVVYPCSGNVSFQERAKKPVEVKCSLSSCVQQPSLVCPV